MDVHRLERDAGLNSYLHGADRLGAQAQPHATGKKYAIEFIYGSTVLWQRVTMPTISHLDADFIVLDDRGKAPLKQR